MRRPSGVGYTSMRRPLLNMRPTHRYHVGAWQLPADLHLLSWLDDEGLEYGIVTDHTLHERGLDALRPYAAVTTASHSEYYTTAMLDGRAVCRLWRPFRVRRRQRLLLAAGRRPAAAVGDGAAPWRLRITCLAATMVSFIVASPQFWKAVIWSATQSA
jgi:hypothetical protein